MGHSSLVPPSVGNATNAIQDVNRSLVYGDGYHSDQVPYKDSDYHTGMGLLMYVTKIITVLFGKS